MESNRIQRILKDIEHAARRVFIRFLSLRSVKAPPTLPLELGDTPSILFLRQDRLGDAIVSTPIFTALKSRYPQGRFIVLLGKNNREIADLLPIECDVFVYQKSFLRDLAMLLKLRKKRLDVVIDLMDNPSATSSLLVAAISPRFSVGIEKDNSSSYNIRVPLLDRSQTHISRRIAELVRPFGIEPSGISRTPVLKKLNVERVTGRIGFNLSAGTSDRYLSEKTTTEIIHGILEYDDVRELVLFSHPNDIRIAEHLISTINDHRLRLAAPTPSFSSFAREIASCEMLLTPDTSAVHLASAYGVPVVAFFLPQSVLHYWTPVGVTFEIVIHGPTLETLGSAEALQAFRSLRKKCGMSEFVSIKEPEYVA